MSWSPALEIIEVHPPNDCPPIKSISDSKFGWPSARSNLLRKSSLLISLPMACWSANLILNFSWTSAFTASILPLPTASKIAPSNQTSALFASVVHGAVLSSWSGTTTRYPWLASYIGTPVWSHAFICKPCTWTIGINFFYPFLKADANGASGQSYRITLLLITPIWPGVVPTILFPSIIFGIWM